MDPRAFLARLPALARSALSPDLRACSPGSGYGLIKLSYGSPKLHYEANHQPRSRTIEIGLHFEADHFTNARLLGAFRVHAKRIAQDLPNARIEEWDKGWARVWEPVAYEELDAALQRDIATRLARYISVLEPILREELPADVPWKLAATRTPRTARVRSARTRTARATRPARRG